MTWEYIAGFFDGEGCITLYDYERKRTYLDNPNQRHRIGKVYKTNEHQSYLYIAQKTRMYVMLNQVNVDVLQKIAKYLDKYDIEYRMSERLMSKKNPKWSDITLLSITKYKSVLKFLEQVYPYLIVKKKKAKITIDYIKNKKWGKHAKHEKGWHHIGRS